MKKFLSFVLIIVFVVGVSMAYHKSLNNEYEDTVIDDIDLENLVEKEVTNNHAIETENDNLKDINSQTKEISDEDNDKSNDVVNTENDENLTNKDEIRKEAEDTPFSNVNDKKAESSNIKETDTKLEVMANSYSTLSNKTNAWGFVRKPEGTQPEFYGPYTKVLDDYEGIYVGNKEEKIIYLTFDEGYENGYTATILDTLKEKGVTAVFFVTMPYVKQNPELIQRMIDEHQIIGNHTLHHYSMPEVTDDTELIEEIMELHNYMVDNYNYEMTYLRPPKGEYSERTVKLALDLGYKTVLWSSAYDDWNTDNQKGSDYAKKMIYNNLHNGCVMLLHAVSKDNDAVLGEVIDEIRNRGYEFKSLDDFER